ncbi:MAG: iron-sulfur cluster assembly protein [Alphaproteobacteria bacterium]
MRPPHLEAPFDHPLWPKIEAGLKEVYDPEIPVNILELGLIYKVELLPETDKGEHDVKVTMSLTSPACPVAQEIPMWVQGAILPVEGVRGCEVDIIWEPAWNLGMMAETARMQLNMFM